MNNLPPYPGVSIGSPIIDMTDAAFLAMCEVQSRGSAVFHRDIVVHLYELAGHPLVGNLPELVTLRPAIVDPLVAAARARLR